MVMRCVLTAVTLLLIAGCSTRSEGNQNRNSSPMAEKPSLIAQLPVGVPTPFTNCNGVSNYSDAYQLVNDGDAIALASITVTGAPSDTVDHTREVPVASATVVAGSLPDLNLTQISEDSNGTDNVLVPGKYLVLVGGSNQGNYYLANGLPGSFVYDGSVAYERCPNFDAPMQPLIVNTGVIDANQLVALFQQAISNHDHDVSPSPTSSSSSLTSTPPNEPSGQPTSAPGVPRQCQRPPPQLGLPEFGMPTCEPVKV